MTLVATIVCCGLLTLLCEPTLAECPSPSDIPVKYNATHYYAAYWFNSQSSPNPIQSCKGTTYKLAENHDQSFTGKGSYDEHGLVVRPGCIVYEFTETEFNGSVSTYQAGVHPNIANGTKSFKLRCNIAPLNCTPTDGFETVMRCNATDAEAATECNYLKTVGTTFSKPLSDAMSLDASIESDLSASFWSLFNETLNTSISTGYNWDHVPAQTKETTRSLEVIVVAPAGYVTKIEQAVGYCKDSNVRTEFFRTKHYK